MITVRHARDRGHRDYGWLDTWHSFSFGDYYDPAHHGFRSLRVINEDYLAPRAGFPLHPHRDMEILTYVIDGAVGHVDSLGNEHIVRPGEIQYMTAGSGIQHSEHNAADGRTHLLQIWIRPEARGLTPGYGQQALPSGAANTLAAIAGPAGDLPATIHQDARVYRGLLTAGGALDWSLATGRHGWLQVVRGTLTAAGVELGPGDGAAISEETRVALRGRTDAEVLAFDLN